MQFSMAVIREAHSGRLLIRDAGRLLGVHPAKMGPVRKGSRNELPAGLQYLHPGQIPTTTSDIVPVTGTGSNGSFRRARLPVWRASAMNCCGATTN